MTDHLLVRTWNIAHGRDVPPGPGYGHTRRKLLNEMSELMTEDTPDVIMLQEVPLWAGNLLRERTGMGLTIAHTYGAHVPFAHVPLPLAAGEWLGRALPDLVRTQFEGQAQAVLYGEAMILVSARRVQLNPKQTLRGEPRIAQLVRLRHRHSGHELVFANVHAAGTAAPAEIEHAGWAAEQFARGAPMVLGGDFNVHADSPVLRRLVARGWVEDAAEVGINHLLVRDLDLEWPATRWLPTRHEYRSNGSQPLRLSDHAPVDAVVAFRA